MYLNHHFTLYSDYIPAQWHQYCVHVPCLINNTAWHYLAISFLSNDAISPLPWFIVVFFYNYILYPRAWVRPIITITDFIWSCFLGNLNLFFIFFITNYQERTNIWQVINSQWINNIKSQCDKFICGSIPTCTLYCSISHLVVVWVLTRFNMSRGGFIDYIDIVLSIGRQQ